MTGRVPIRLVVTDVDGTLVRQDKTLAPSTMAAARALRRHGVKLALVSSRPPKGLDALLPPLAIDTPRAGFNGAEIVGAAGETLSEWILPQAVAQEAVARLEAAGVDPWVFARGQWILRNPQAPYVPRERMAIRMDYTLVDDFAPHLFGVHKIMGSHTDFALMARMEAELRSILGDGADVARSQNYYLDVTHAQANKGFAALALARLLGIEPQAMACIGDMPNDTPMFAVCGLSIAMGNAPDAVKVLAEVVVGTNDADGWSEAVDRFVLPRAGS